MKTKPPATKAHMQARYVEQARKLVERHSITRVCAGLDITWSTMRHRLDNPTAVRREHVLALQALRGEL